MAWFMRGVQSAVFHYASCAPCAGYKDSRRRQKDAKEQRKARERLQREDPGTYRHPEPTGTNPYWGEEMALGPGPPPRRARRASTRGMGITKAGTQSTVASQAGSSTDDNRADDNGADDARRSADSLDDENWNRRRYQREDEDLWGLDDAPLPAHHAAAAAPPTFAGFHVRRPTTSRSGSYYSARAPPVNDLHPPVVSILSPDAADNRWMLQPPPKASVMAGKERASNRSRSDSGASSRVELALQREESLQRQVSTRKVRQKLERGLTPDLPSSSPYGSSSTLAVGQRYDRCRTPQARPPSSTSSHRKLRDSAMARTDTMITRHSSRDSNNDAAARAALASRTTPTPEINVIRVRQSRHILSTVLSSGDGRSPSPTPTIVPTGAENTLPEKPTPAHHPCARYSTNSADTASYLMKPRAPLSSSDVSSLNVLQDLVSPRALLNSRFVSAPLVEAKIRLPPADTEEDAELSRRQKWVGGEFGVSRGWEADESEEPVRVPFDSLVVAARDPTLRWSVDF